MAFWSNVGKFFTGSPEKRENVSTLRPEQEQLYNQLQSAGMNKGAGGAFGDAADYYRDLLSNDSQTMQQMQAPEMRQFNEQTIPGLSEQFAGMGSGGLSSSGFRNAAVNAGTDLSERLGAMRANLRQQGAAGLAGIGQQGLGNYSQNMVTQPGSEGFLAQAAPALAQAGMAYATGGMSAMGGGMPGMNSFGAPKVGGGGSPYGQPPQPQTPSRQMPNFNFGR